MRYISWLGWTSILGVLSLLPVLADDGTESRGHALLIIDSQYGNPYDDVRAALLPTLAERGHVEGENLRVSLHVAGNDIAQGEQILREALVDEAYDVVLVGGTVATIAARNVLQDDPRRPVVFCAPTDPVGIGVVDALDRPPSGHFTGVSYPVPPKARLRFIRQLMPEARTLGLIYADMPQSHSYNAWLHELLAEDPEFADLQILFRPVPLVTGEEGDRQMAAAAIPLIKELDSLVDAFIKPNDQLGTRRALSEVVQAHASKPLIGLVRDDVMEGWGATAVVYPSHQSIGRQCGEMVAALLAGKPIASLPPSWPRQFGYAVDLSLTQRFGIRVPISILQLAGDDVVR